MPGISARWEDIILQAQDLQDGESRDLFKLIYESARCESTDKLKLRQSICKAICVGLPKINHLRTFEDLERYFEDLGGMEAFRKRLKKRAKVCDAEDKCRLQTVIAKLTMENEVLTKQKDELECDSLCSVCQDARASVVIHPCLHLCACPSCIPRIVSNFGKCPICKQGIERHERVFVV